MVLLEAGALALISMAIGTAIGFGVIYYVSLHGIDYVGIEYGGMTFRELIYPVMTLGQFAILPLWVFLFSLIAGLYPAVFAARLEPAAAMRQSF